MSFISRAKPDNGIVDNITIHRRTFQTADRKKFLDRIGRQIAAVITRKCPQSLKKQLSVIFLDEDTLEKSIC